MDIYEAIFMFIMPIFDFINWLYVILEKRFSNQKNYPLFTKYYFKGYYPVLIGTLIVIVLGIFIDYVPAAGDYVEILHVISALVMGSQLVYIFFFRPTIIIKSMPDSYLSQSTGK